MVVFLDTRVEHLDLPFLVKAGLPANLGFHVQREHQLRAVLLFLALPQGSIPPPRGAPSVAPPASRPPQGYKGNPPVARNGPPPAQAGTAPPAASTGTLPLDTALLSSASPMEQKQMLGEVIYMRIVS
jgi:hypothetical protein